jgi:CRISPR/Cas system CMR-associated protein Cmr5 small subunit
MKKNLEQIRAANALKKADVPIPGKQGGEVVKKVPPLIMNHGLLATGAYAFSDESFKEVFNRIADHLGDEHIGLLPSSYSKTTKGLMDYLANEADSVKLKLCTAEAMAWLEYARRFIKKKD